MFRMMPTSKPWIYLRLPGDGRAAYSCAFAASWTALRRFRGPAETPACADRPSEPQGRCSTGSRLLEVDSVGSDDYADAPVPVWQAPGKQNGTHPRPPRAEATDRRATLVVSAAAPTYPPSFTLRMAWQTTRRHTEQHCQPTYQRVREPRGAAAAPARLSR